MGYFLQLLYTVLFRFGMTLWSSKRLGRHSDFLFFFKKKSSLLLFLSGTVALHYKGLERERALWSAAILLVSISKTVCILLLLTGQITRFRVGWRRRVVCGREGLVGTLHRFVSQEPGQQVQWSHAIQGRRRTHGLLGVQWGGGGVRRKSLRKGCVTPFPDRLTFLVSVSI